MNFFLISIFLLILLFFVFLMSFIRERKLFKKINLFNKYFNYLIRDASIATFEIDLKNEEITWDEYAYKNFFGRDKGFVPPHQIVDLLEFIHPNDRVIFSSAVNNLAETHTLIPHVFRIIYPNKQIHYLKMQNLKNSMEEKSLIICSDITEEKHYQMLLEIQDSIKQILKDSHHMAEAMPKILKIFGNCFELCVATFWIRDPNANVLRCQEIWQDHRIDISDFKEMCNQFSFAKGDGFPGQIWENRSPLWIDDLKDDPHFFKSSISTTYMQSVFGFPLFEEHAVYGVIEFFKLNPFYDDINRYFSHIVDFMGDEIKRFLEQKSFERISSFLSSALSFVGEAVINHDLQGTILTWNRGAELMLGFSAFEMVNHSLNMIFSTETFQSWEETLSKAGKGITVQNVKLLLHKADGKKIHAHVTVSPLQEKGEIIGLCTICQNMTAIHEMEEIVKKNEERLRTFVENASDWLWAIDSHNKVTFSNQSIRSILGYEPEEIMGTDLFLLVKEDEREKLEHEIAQVSAKKKGWTSRLLPWKSKQEGIKWLESNADPLLGTDGKLKGFIGANRDVTEQIRVDKIKNEFVSMVSHELRTPLTSILGSLSLFISRSKTLTEEKSKQLIEIAYQNCQRLIEIINDILEIERIESGKFEVHLQPLDISKLVEDAIKANQFFAEKFGISIEVENPSLESVAFADKNRIIQVLTNLLTNAVKFSKSPARIIVKIEIFPTAIRTSVIDHGFGIPIDLQPRIFEKFVTGKIPDSKKIIGTGLGLSISKYIIERLGGTIQFTSNPDQGSTFYFDLPRWNKEIPLIIPKPFKEFLAPILIFSDDKIAIDQLAQVFRDYGFSLQYMTNEIQIIKKVSSKNISAFFLDLEKINLNFFGFLQKFYVSEEKSNIPLIILEGSNAQNKLKEDPIFKQLPILGWFSKPINQEKLSKLAIQIKADYFLGKPRIIYLERNQELMSVIKSILQEKIEVFFAHSVKEAQEILMMHPIDLLLVEPLTIEGKWNELFPAFNVQNKREIPAIIFFSTVTNESYPTNIKKVLNKLTTTNSELMDTIFEIVKIINY